MTLLLGLLTQDYVLLAADRRVTFIQSGDVKDDEQCKLVSFCGHTAIAYTGLAELGGCPTHEWICHRLVDVRAAGPLEAYAALREAASEAFERLDRNPPYSHTFVLAGFAPMKGGGWGPYFAPVSNTYVHDGKAPRLQSPSNRFNAFLRLLKPSELYAGCREGVHLMPGRENLLDRNVRRLLQRGVGPKEMLRLLVDEIVFTATEMERLKGKSSVGKTVLAVSIPRGAIEQKRPEVMVIASPTPDPTVPTFGYF